MGKGEGRGKRSPCSDFTIDHCIQDSRTRIYKTASTQSGQFLATEKSARHSTRPNYFYCPSPDFTSRCANCRADNRGHFNCFSVGNKQSLCPLMWGAQEKSGGGRHIKKFRPARHCAPTCKLLPTLLNRTVGNFRVHIYN